MNRVRPALVQTCRAKWKILSAKEEAMEDIKDLNELWEKLPELAARAGYEAGLEHLAAGYPIYYCEDEHPGEIIKHYPDGHREMVRLENDKEVYVRSIGKASG